MIETVLILSQAYRLILTNHKTPLWSASPSNEGSCGPGSGLTKTLVMVDTKLEGGTEVRPAHFGILTPSPAQNRNAFRTSRRMSPHCTM